MVRHELAHRNGCLRVKSALYGKSGEVGPNRPIDVNPALLGELHGARGGEEFGNRTDLIHRLGTGAHILCLVGKTESLRPQHTLVIDERDARTRDVVLTHLLGDEPARVFARIGVVAGHTFRGLAWRGRAAGKHSQQYGDC